VRTVPEVGRGEHFEGSTNYERLDRNNFTRDADRCYDRGGFWPGGSGVSKTFRVMQTRP
jgi:hypothetical protein